MRIPRTEAQKEARKKQLKRFRNKERVRYIQELEEMQRTGYNLTKQQLYNLRRLKQTAEVQEIIEEEASGFTGVSFGEEIPDELSYLDTQNLIKK